MTNAPEQHYIEAANLSHAWGQALRLVLSKGEVAPLVLAVTGFKKDVPQEDTSIRSALDRALDGAGLQSTETVANTIFPVSLWNPEQPADLLYRRYNTILPKLRKSSRKNKRGLYFERLISGGPTAQPNQLDFIIKAWNARRGVRRSALQLAVFDGSRDHTTAAQLGFPCLQHVTVAPTEGGLSLNAFYATQYIVERAYGNYLGLCRLGQFIAHELKMPLVRMTCFTGISLHDSAIAKGKLDGVMAAIEAALPSR